jgi:hypothetical protein
MSSIGAPFDPQITQIAQIILNLDFKLRYSPGSILRSYLRYDGTDDDVTFLGFRVADHSGWLLQFYPF